MRAHDPRMRNERPIRPVADHADGNDERYWLQGQGFASILLHFYCPPSSYLRLLLLLSYLLYIEM